MSDLVDSPYQVFLSYSTKDQGWADAACAALEGRRVRCWVAPRDIVPGTEWGAAIIDGIDRCRVMVLVFSAHANGSAQVRREVERALGKGLAILPLRVEDIRPHGAMEYALSNTHWLDAFTPPTEDRLWHLADSVEALLGTSPARSGTIPVTHPRAASRSGASTVPTSDAAVRPAVEPVRGPATPNRRRAAWVAALGLVTAGVVLAVGLSDRSNPPPTTGEPSGDVTKADSEAGGDPVKPRLPGAETGVGMGTAIGSDKKEADGGKKEAGSGPTDADGFTDETARFEGRWAAVDENFPRKGPQPRGKVELREGRPPFVLTTRAARQQPRAKLDNTTTLWEIQGGTMSTRRQAGKELVTTRGPVSFRANGEKRYFDHTGGDQNRGLTWTGIYKFNDNVLEICYREVARNDIPSLARPLAFPPPDERGVRSFKFERIGAAEGNPGASPPKKEKGPRPPKK